MGRPPCCDADGLKKGAWTAEEDEKLISYIQKHGEGGWRSLPEKAGLQRCGKSCRLRWANYLRPGIKRGEFTLEEERTIIQLHAALGNRWAAIARHLPKRTDNEIKNYWNAHLKKRLAKMGIDSMTDMPSRGSSTASSSGRPQQSRGSSSSTTANLLNKLATNLRILQRLDTNFSSQSMSVSTPSTTTISSFSESISAPVGPTVSNSAWMTRDMPTTLLDSPDVWNPEHFSESVDGCNAADDASTLSNVSTPTCHGVLNKMNAKFSSLNFHENELQDWENCILQEPLEGGTSTGSRAPVVDPIDDFSDDIDISGILDCSHECDMGSPFSNDEFNLAENTMLPLDQESP